MIYNNNKTSLLVGSQLPGFVKDNPDYANFSLFLKAYYEWMELSNTANSQVTYTDTSGQGVTLATKNILSYKDVDNTIDGFTDYFINDFLPYFPKDALIDKNQAVKVARQLYQSKGTPASYQFLFRVLFNSEFEYFQTKDAVLKPSDGQWYVAKSLKLATNDINFRNISNYRVFGETTKSIATIEASVLAGDKTEVFISNVERLFESGEYVRIIDQNKQDVLVGGQPLRAKVVGQISTININPNNRGLTYNIGDPVIVYGGMDSPTLHGATARVSETTRGSIKSIGVTNGGYGYTANPTTQILFGGDVGGAEAIVVDLDDNASKRANATFVPTQALSAAWNTRLNQTYTFFTTHPTSNIDTKLSDALSFYSFPTYPIGSVIVTSGGGGISRPPEVTAKSLYASSLSETPTLDLALLGILAPIQITNGGVGYQANDRIIISGGSGYGAYANVVSVSGSGAILDTDYVYDTNNVYPLGGMGYKQTDTDIVVSVQSANNRAHGASLYVPGILGAGAEFLPIVDRAGSITKIQVLDPGEDYVSQPKVSLKVQDILVSNVSIANLPKIGDVVFQGANINVSTYRATVNSVSLVQPYNEANKSLYNLRVFEYSSNPNPSRNLTIEKQIGQINMIMANTNYNGAYNKNGYKIYGDGSALATATFLNGLVVSQGQYLDQRGQPSSFSVLQNENYNNFTYEITVSKEIEKYRDVLLNLLHPSGTKVIGRMVDRTELDYNTNMQEALYGGRPLYASVGGIGQAGATATMNGDFETTSTNIIQFHDIPPSVNLAEVILPGTFIQLESSNHMNVHSRAVNIDYVNNRVEVRGNSWVTFGNVATVTGQSGSNTINITSITNTFNLVNNGRYSNTMYPLMDIVATGDRILVANNSVLTVDRVDYTTNNGIIYLTTNLTSNANSTLSVSKTIFANSNYQSNQIKLYGPIGTTYIPELATENGQILTTEDGLIILLG